MLDIWTGWTHGSLAERKAADLEAVRNGQSRVVRCYLEPGSDEHRRNRMWKAGYLTLSLGGGYWAGTRKQWGSIEFPARIWSMSWREPTRDDHPGKRALFNVIECRNGEKRYTIGVPKPDTALCLAVLSEEAMGSEGCAFE